MSLSHRRRDTGSDSTVNRRHFDYDTFTTDPLMALVDTFFSGDRGTHMVNRLSGWSGDIKVDATETKDAFLISADLPGVRKDDIKVSMSPDRILTIEAERKEELEESDAERNMHWKERMFGKMQRSFRLNKTADPKQCSCKFDNGVLNIHVGKREPQSDISYLKIE